MTPCVGVKLFGSLIIMEGNTMDNTTTVDTTDNVVCCDCAGIPLENKGCDAEYCDDPGCKKRHYHTRNCRCADWCAEFDDA